MAVWHSQAADEALAVLRPDGLAGSDVENYRRLPSRARFFHPETMQGDGFHVDVQLVPGRVYFFAGQDGMERELPGAPADGEGGNPEQQAPGILVENQLVEEIEQEEVCFAVF